MVTEAKEEDVQELKEKFEEANSLTLSDYRGLSANEMVDLRERFTKKGVDYRVVKNTLASIAAREAELEDLSEDFQGPIGVAIGYDDAVLPFKIAKECQEEFDDFDSKCGVLEGQLVPTEQMEEIAKLSSREELLAQVATALKAPIRELAFVLKAKIKELVAVLDQVAESRSED